MAQRWLKSGLTVRKNSGIEKLRKPREGRATAKASRRERKKQQGDGTHSEIERRILCSRGREDPTGMTEAFLERIGWYEDKETT